MSSSGDIYIGGYRLVNPVYAGQSSRTWQAFDEKKRRYCAIKILFQSARKNKQQIKFFNQEYKIGSCFDCDDIIRFYDFGWQDGCPYIVMEYVPAPNIKQLIQLKYSNYCPVLPELLPAMVKALATFNDAGFVHRDIKPDNFLYSPEFGVKLIDFALARKVKGPIKRKIFPFKDKTEGTMSYMSPDQIKGVAFDSRADIYSLGCSIFELLANRLPYTGTSTQELLQKHLSAPPPSITARNPNITPEFAQFLAQMMAKKPENRFKSSREVYNGIRSIRIFKRTPVEGDNVY